MSITLAAAIARRNGLPVSLVSGSGARLSEALVRDEAVAAVAFVGGRAWVRRSPAPWRTAGAPYMIEMEGVNAYGVSGFSDWELLRGQLRAGFEYAKQRCTAYTRFVVERTLVPDFLDAYLAIARDLVVGHPLLVAAPDDPPPDVDFGPLINSAKVEELRERYQEAVGAGAVMLHRGAIDSDRVPCRPGHVGLFPPDGAARRATQLRRSTTASPSDRWTRSSSWTAWTSWWPR